MKAMNEKLALKAFATGWKAPLDVLRDATGMNVIDLCCEGLDATIAKLVVKLSDVYCTPTNASRQQQEVCGMLAAMEHTFNTMAEIESFVGKLADKKKKWEFRLELASEAPVLRTLRKRARQLLEEYNDTAEQNPEMKLRSKAVPGSSLSDMSVRGPAHLVKSALDRATAFAREHSIEPAEALLRLATSGDGTGPEIAPAVIVPLNGEVLSWEPEGADEKRLSLTNGTTMTGADFVRAKLAEQGFALLVDEITGEDLELYRLRDPNTDDGDPRRFATLKERLRQRLKTPVCAWPGCGKAADECQIHHIVAYKHGGTSEMDNYTALCDFDNGRNDDDRDQPRYGHIEKRFGLDWWVPAFGGEPEVNMHPVARGGAIRAVREAAGLPIYQ